MKITGSKRPVSALCASFVPELLKNAFLFAVNKNLHINGISLFHPRSFYA